MFKTQLTENKMIAVTAFLVVAMAFPTYQTLAQNDDAGEAAAVAVQASGDREPASVATQVLTSHKPTNPFHNVDLSCAKKRAGTLNVDGGFIQFQGKACLPHFKEADVQIINKSNGFTASIFVRGTDKYQTDLIQLQPGENEIAIRYRERSGKSVEEVVRINASSI